MKYELTEETVEYFGHTLHRIRYLESGELGGWIEFEANFPQDSKGNVLGDGKVSGDAVVRGGVVSGGVVRGDAVVRGGEVRGDAVVSGGVVCGDAVVRGGVVCGGEVSGGEVSGGVVCGDAVVRGGVVCGGVVCGDAVVRGGEVRGDAVVCGGVVRGGVVCGGSWEYSPLQIQGTRYFFSVSSKTQITIGCHTKTIDEWLLSYEAEFDDHHFTEKQRLEYKMYFNLAAQLYGWETRLPLDEGE